MNKIKSGCFACFIFNFSSREAKKCFTYLDFLDLWLAFHRISQTCQLIVALDKLCLACLNLPKIKVKVLFYNKNRKSVNWKKHASFATLQISIPGVTNTLYLTSTSHNLTNHYTYLCKSDIFSCTTVLTLTSSSCFASCFVFCRVKWNGQVLLLCGCTLCSLTLQ